MIRVKISCLGTATHKDIRAKVESLEGWAVAPCESGSQRSDVLAAYLHHGGDDGTVKRLLDEVSESQGACRFEVHYYTSSDQVVLDRRMDRHQLALHMNQELDWIGQCRDEIGPELGVCDDLYVQECNKLIEQILERVEREGLFNEMGYPSFQCLRDRSFVGSRAPGASQPPQDDMDISIDDEEFIRDLQMMSAVEQLGG